MKHVTTKKSTAGCQRGALSGQQETPAFQLTTQHGCKVVSILIAEGGIEKILGVSKWCTDLLGMSLDERNLRDHHVLQTQINASRCTHTHTVSKEKTNNDDVEEYVTYTQYNPGLDAGNEMMNPRLSEDRVPPMFMKHRVTLQKMQCCKMKSKITYK